MAKEPPKENGTKPSTQNIPEEVQSPSGATVAEETQVPQVPVDSIPQVVTSNPSKEHISLGSETGAESAKEGDTETSSPLGTPDQPKRGRKTEKKRREEQSYKDVVQGSQHTIPEMMNTRSGMKLGKTPKGGQPSQPGK